MGLKQTLEFKVLVDVYAFDEEVSYTDLERQDKADYVYLRFSRERVSKLLEKLKEDLARTPYVERVYTEKDQSQIRSTNWGPEDGEGIPFTPGK